MLDIEALLTPVGIDNPCGEDLAFSPEIDEVARARVSDDPSLEQGAWVTALKEADWRFVGKRCAALIQGRSKDLQLAVWLVEANAKTGGLPGLTEGLRLVTVLCQRYWDGLYPLPDEDGHDRRIGNLAWLAGRIAALAKEMPLAEGGALTLQAWETARARGPGATAELDLIRSRNKPAFCQLVVDDCQACIAALADLEHAIDALLGADAPGFGAGRDALQDVTGLMTPGLPAAAPSTALAPVQAPGAAMASFTTHVDGPVQHRDQALAQLRQVAQFFRRTEPHSPVAYLADKAARWGEQPLHAWLRAVIKDEVSLARLEDLLGIEQPAP